MKRKFFSFAVILGILAVAGALASRAAQTHSHPQNAFTPDGVKWGPAPPFMIPGAQFAVLEGDPTASTGDYTIRIKMPEGYRINPHWHPLRENVTVISGTLLFGMGDKFESDKMTAFPAGSFAYLDPDMHHYVMAKGDTIVQVHGKSPVKFNYINPADDPSMKH